MGIKFYEVCELMSTIFKEKSNMNNIEITVKVNGIETPLHQISELTLSKIREASKPKEIPVARTANHPNYSSGRRLILRMPKNIKVFIDAEIIVIDLENGFIQNNYDYNETKKPEDHYTNIQTVI